MRCVADLVRIAQQQGAAEYPSRSSVEGSARECRASFRETFCDGEEEFAALARPAVPGKLANSAEARAHRFLFVVTVRQACQPRAQTPASNTVEKSTQHPRQEPAKRC